MGIAIVDQVRAGELDLFEELDDPFPGFITIVPGDPSMDQKGFSDLVPAGEDGVQGGHGLLEDHRDLRPSVFPDLPFAQT